MLRRLADALRSRGQRTLVSAVEPTSPPEVRNSLEIQFFGLRRSGNHAVIAWLAQQYPSPIVFLNNVRHFHDPFTNYLMGRVPNGFPIKKLEVHDAEALRMARKALLVISYEDLVLRKLGKPDVVLCRKEWIGLSASRWKILLLRDFYNWMASRIRLFEKKGAGFEQILDRIEFQVRLWLMYAREYVGETHYLAPGTLAVSFNRWSEDQAYRSDILRVLGIPARDNSRAIVPRAGGGSSFDGTSFSGNAEKMEIGNRWSYLERAELATVLDLIVAKRDEIDGYNERIFGQRCPFR